MKKYLLRGRLGRIRRVIGKRHYLIKWDGLSLGSVEVVVDLSGLNITAIEIREAYKQYLPNE